MRPRLLISILKNIIHLPLGKFLQVTGVLLLLGKVSLAAAELPKSEDHPLMQLDRSFRRPWQAVRRSNRDANKVMRRYLQHIEKYLQEQGIAYTSQYRFGEEVRLDILPGTQSPLNRLAQELALEDFALQVGARRNLEGNDYEHKYQLINYGQQALFIGTWFFVRDPIGKSPRLASNLDLIRLYHQRQAPYLFFTRFENIDAFAWGTRHQDVLPPATWLALEAPGPLLIAHTSPSSRNLLLAHTAALDLYHMFAKSAQEPLPAPATRNHHFYKMRTDFAVTWANAIYNLLDYNLITYLLIQRDPRPTMHFDKGYLDLTVVPQPQLPTFKIHLRIPASRLVVQEGTDPAQLLAEPTWQRLYFYFVKFTELLRETYPAMKKLKGFDRSALAALRDRWRPIRTFAADINTQELPEDFAKYWQEHYVDIQRQNIQDLIRVFAYPNPAKFTEQQAAVHCKANLLAAFRQDSSSPRSP